MTRLRAATAIVLLALSARASLGDDWPQWRGPGRDGVWHEADFLSKFPPGGPKVSWRAAVGRGWSSPVVARGRVVVTDVQVIGRAATERVLCFEESTGRPLWSHTYPVNYPDWALGPEGGGPRATPVVCDGKVYTLGALGQLFCLDAATGAVAWKRDLAVDLRVREFTGITASPLVEKDLLILYVCGKPGATVVAFDRTTGREAWRALDDSFTYSSPIVFTAGGKRQLVVWTQEAVTSLDPATGRTWWRELLRTPGDSAVSTPVYADGRLLVGGLMFQLNADRPAATVLWPQSKALKLRILSNTSTAVLRDGCVFSATTNGELACLDADSGRELWQVEAVTASGNGAAIHLVVQGDAVLLFTDQGDLVRARMDKTGYHELARAHLLDGTYAFAGRERAWAMPAFADGHVFARNDRELISADVQSEPGG